MGKVNFGYILGWSVLSMLALNWLVNLLAGPAQARFAAPRFRTRALLLTALCAQGLELYRCGSLLGYSMLPIVLFSAAAVFLPARRVRGRRLACRAFAQSNARRTCRGFTACTLGALATTWSTHTASSLLAAIVPSLEARRAACLLRVSAPDARHRDNACWWRTLARWCTGCLRSSRWAE